MRREGKVAIVTGAGQGIGRAYAVRLAREGARVAVAEIQAERQRALTDVRAQVADLALMAASRVVGETMNEPRERRLVEQFLAEVGSNGGGPAGADGREPGSPAGGGPA